MELIIINIIESILLTWFISSLLIVRKRKLLYQFIVILVNFSIITISNYIFIYDLFLTTNLIICNTLISYYFAENDFPEILFIVCLESTYYNLMNSLSIIINNSFGFLDAIILSKVLYLIFACFVVSFLKKKELFFNKQLYYILSAILYGVHFVISHLVTIYITFEYRYPDLLISLFIFSVVIIGLFYVIVSISDIFKTNLSYENLKSKQENDIIITSLYNEIKIAKHDVKHVYQLLNYYIQQQDYKAIDNLILEKTNQVDKVPVLINSSNELINVIINNKLIQAYTREIQVRCDILIQKKIAVTDFDLNELLSNALDNALENCTEKGNISIKINQKEQILSIAISNSIAKKTDFKTKKNPKYHGFGLKSINKIVSKYHGQVHIEQSDNTYFIYITLLLNNRL